jgi:hypothetical protein
LLVARYGRNGKEILIEDMYIIITTWNKEGEKYGF